MPRKSSERTSENQEFRNAVEEECDDPRNTLSVPEADSNAIMLVNVPSPPMRDEIDAGAGEGTYEKCDQSVGEDDDVGQDWNPSLYMLQARAPKPKCIKVDKKITVSPSYYGMEYHGYLSRPETESLLGVVEDGTYLVRDTLSGIKILSFMMNKRMYNYRLYYENGQHYVGENHFEEIDDLVQDNLITLYLQQHNVAQTMHEGQIMSIARRKKAQKKLHGLQRACGRRVKGLKGKKAWEYQQTISASSITNVLSPSPTPSPTLSPTLSPERTCLPTDVTTCISDLDHYRCASPDSDESNLDHRNGVTRRSTPNLHRLSGSTPSYVQPSKESKRNDSTSSLPVFDGVNSGNERYSVIVATLRDAINDDKRKQQLKLDKSNTRLKPCSSEGRIGLAATLKSGRVSSTKEADDRPSRAYSCHIPYFTSLDKITDVAVKGTNAFAKSSMEALAKHTSGPSSPYFKAHNFTAHTYLGPTWCEICHHYLWGLKHQGLRCKDCGMDIHKQCLPLCLRLECYPNKQFVKRVFGVDLTTLVKLEGKLVPNILSECITEIESRENDLSSTGIYRLSGQTSEIVILKEKYDEGEQIDFSQYLDISILTGAVKMYLRELPIPLITFDAYHEVIKVSASIDDPEDASIDWISLKNALKLLPKAHYNTLKFLAKHLYKIHLKASENKMSAQNLAVVFAPTLMKAPCEDGSLIHDLPIQRNLIECLILFHDSIFE